jgi:hypothetical protein
VAAGISKRNQRANPELEFISDTGLDRAAIPRPKTCLEDYNMRRSYCSHRAHRFIASLFLAAALVAPVSFVAAATPQAVGVQVRVYDRDHHDYHNWDDHEDGVYRAYLTDQHITYRAYAKQNRKTQRDYWNWRHSHPD